MELDSTTVVATAAFVAGMSGGFLMFAGGQLQAVRPATIWGVSNLLTALGMMLVFQGQNYDLAFLSMMSAAALTWIAVRRFDRKIVPISYLVAGLAVWTIVALGPWEIPFGVRSAVFLMIAFTYLVACAGELWRGRSEMLPGRWPVLALVAMDGLAALAGAAGLAAMTAAPSLPPGGIVWVIYISTVVFTVGTAVFFLAMTKERSAALHQLASRTDSLTGLSNRQALMELGSAAVAEARAGGRDVSVALFDLDHFKSVNDTFGHRTGDAVLRRFAESAAQCVRSTDALGRVGGEEFVAVVPGAGREAAIAFAERLRSSFAADCSWVDGKPVCATVSCGISVLEASEPLAEFEELLDRADAALYVAKAAGRDRVSVRTPGQIMRPWPAESSHIGDALSA